MDVKKISDKNLRVYCSKHDISYIDANVLTDYCIANGLDPLSVIKRLYASNSEDNRMKALKRKNRKITIKNKKKGTALPTTVQDIILHVMKKVEDKKSVNLDEFTSIFEADMHRYGIEVRESSNCPLVGFVSSLLYEYAEKSKFKGLKESTFGRKRLTNPVLDSELPKLLKTRFRKEDFNHIAGILNVDYINRYYPINSKTLQFEDENGKTYNIEGARNWKGSGKQEARELLIEVVEKYLLGSLEDKVDESLSLNYLGLEGPHFGTYLSLHRLINSKKLCLKAVIPEYNYRLKNLMKSLVKTNPSKLFSNVEILYGDVDNLILTDFNNCAVTFGGENSLKQDSMKFDVVFLDYLCPYAGRVTDIKEGHKKRTVLENLLEKRLKNKSVVALTFNLTGRMSHLEPNKAADIIIGDIDKVFESTGYRIVGSNLQPYSGTKQSHMLFVAYFLQRI